MTRGALLPARLVLECVLAVGGQLRVLPGYRVHVELTEAELV